MHFQIFNPIRFFKKRTGALSDIQRPRMSSKTHMWFHGTTLYCIIVWMSNHPLIVYTMLQMLNRRVIRRYLVRWKIFFLLWFTRMRSWHREGVCIVQEIRCWRWWREASEEGLLLPLALVTSATCGKVKRSAFESVCSTAADDVDRA